MKPLLSTKPPSTGQTQLWRTAPILLLCLVNGTTPAEPAPLSARPVAQETFSALPDIVFDKSVFVDAPEGGKDPFFPNSKRFEPKAPEAPQPTSVDILKTLFLKGICGTKERMLALINHRTLEVGEEGEYRQGNLSIRIRVVEITDKSVFFTIDGSSDRLELRLRNGL
jgi:hypothetical protein